MQTTNSNMEIKPQNFFFTLRVLMGAMAMSVIIFGVALFVTKNWYMDQVFFEQLLKEIPVQILFALGVLVLVGRTSISNLMLRQATKELDIKDVQKLLLASFTPFLVRLMMAEFSAIMGFVIAMVYKESTAFLILGLSAIFAILREWPTLEKFKGRVELVQLSHKRGRT